MSENNVRKKNKGNYSYVIAMMNDNSTFHVMKFVKTRGKDTIGKTKREIVFDEQFSQDQALSIDNGILSECVIDLIKGALNEE